MPCLEVDSDHDFLLHILVGVVHQRQVLGQARLHEEISMGSAINAHVDGVVIAKFDDEIDRS